ncbi:cytochrome c family protein [Halomonas sp. McH1-25]|uniref:cytochrome c3 family protein n=1 Tax=unclassified Halomonas TaxID=2609666 RepID=UPI001EF560AA|nr:MULTISPECIES: cytochrome c3 family protein [unclassified Halomonas]MCG7601954.1 cytochrome c family protein [Halomonas sp. McH1-25]MCP1341605.1 cytochrome c family protein [Halomonas sp. FL8]MCP1362411.1 cytochrome c family protein [Halomonas sp. BBD45]MCP1364339.1 cytochrome c family protein [Halomonas sp. BBD48]
MPQIFPRRANSLVSMALWGGAFGVVILILVAVTIGSSAHDTGVYTTPEQPVPFSHEHHVSGLGLDCQYCHTGVEKSDFAGLPPTYTCMTCHSQLWTNAEMLEPVRQSLKRDEPIEWVRVHDLPDFTYFSHRAHVNNGVGCESCHGRVDEMPITSQRKPLTMQWCLSCHRNPEPNLRPADKITAMGYDPAKDGIPGHELLERYAIRKDNLTECVTCHR